MLRLRTKARPGSGVSQCPYCGERVELNVEELGMSAEDYVEDCPVCCRPWNVHVSREGDEPVVTLTRDDD